MHKTRCAALAKMAAVADKAKREFKTGNFAVLDLDVLVCNACTLGRLAAVEKIVAAGGNVNSVHADNGFTPIHAAAQEGHFRVIAALIGHGALVNARCNDGATPIYLCAQYGHLRAATVLLDHGRGLAWL